MIQISHIEQVFPGLLRITVYGTRSRANTSLWVQAPTRKEHTCVRCNRTIPKGAKAYRTTLDTDYRMERLCEACGLD